MGWLAQNKYHLTGEINSGLTISPTNPQSGTAPATWAKYDSGTYNQFYYTPTGFYEGSYYSPNIKKIKLTYTGTIGEAKYSYCESDDGATYSAWASEVNLSAGTIIIFSMKYWKLRLIYYTPDWAHTDTITGEILYLHIPVHNSITALGSIESLIKQNKMKVFRRIYMKRRSVIDYETNWQLIPEKYIKSYGTISYSIDDIKANFYNISSFSFSVINNDGFFSGVDQDKSFFYSYFSVYRTLVKIEAGYIDYDGTEYPANPILFIGILGEDYKYSDTNIISFQVKNLTSLFQEISVADIPGMGITQTANELVSTIKNYVDSNGIYFFQKYITSTNWFIESTTTYYNMATSTTLQGMNCWSFLTKIAEAENKVIYINYNGEFYFQAKQVITSTAKYHFSGIGDNNNSYGHNIIGNLSIDDNVRKVYNRIRIQFNNEDTDTSYYIKKENWNWGDSSSSFMFGVRTYEYSNIWLANTMAAQTIGDLIYNEYKWAKKETTFDSKFIPHLFINDRVNLTYRTKQILSNNADLWGHFVWGQAFWGTKKGYNINIENMDSRITKITHNVDSFKSSITLREI
jgi:hypothetical protein